MSPRLHIAGDLVVLVIAALLVAAPTGVVFPPAAVAARVLLGGYSGGLWGWVALPLCTAAAATAAMLAALGADGPSVSAGMLWPTGLAVLAGVQMASAR